ncbi:MAG: DnaD domain protein [Eubacteriales bacterium]|nr:DnaD domain protein [Eubacteriales bacterium]
MDVTCSFQVNATVVANDFIDRYMAAANGEYVKVYLYMLRHQQERLDVSGIADALNHTESDVRRALAYWEKLGALRTEAAGQRMPENRAGAGIAGADISRSGMPGAGVSGMDMSGAGISESVSAAGQGVQSPVFDRLAEQEAAQAARAESGAVQAVRSEYSGVAQAVRSEHGVAVQAARSESGTAARTASSRPVYSQDQVNRLAGDEDFTQLLYIAQKYMNKVFTPRECEVFAYLYDGLHMTAELLEYLVEYCVQGGHTSIRYIETVALNWHEKGLKTVEEAKSYSSCFTKDSFAVMRAFGLTDRKPGDAEKELIERWFGIYGFARDLVLEACNRTLEATHAPSFRYADKILTEWRKAGVKSLQDVAVLDQKRKGRQNAARTPGKKTNQFHNFEQRDTDYDSIMMDQVKSWIRES